MNKKVKKKWVEALRSRKYKQCYGQLREVDDDNKVIGHCCLGVLCDLYDKKGWGKVFHDCQIELPEEVAKWAGLETTDPIISKRFESEKWCGGLATTLNDTGKKFHEIADFIERNL